MATVWNEEAGAMIDVNDPRNTSTTTTTTPSTTTPTTTVDPNAPTQAQAAITSWYESVYGRKPDLGGYLYWLTEYEKAAAAGKSVNDVYAAFVAGARNETPLSTASTTTAPSLTVNDRELLSPNPVVDTTGYDQQVTLASGDTSSIGDAGKYVQSSVKDATTKSTTDIITDWYQAVYGRAPDPAGLEWWVKQYDNAIAMGSTPNDVYKSFFTGVQNEKTLDTAPTSYTVPQSPYEISTGAGQMDPEGRAIDQQTITGGTVTAGTAEAAGNVTTPGMEATGYDAVTIDPKDIGNVKAAKGTVSQDANASTIGQAPDTKIATGEAVGSRAAQGILSKDSLAEAATIKDFSPYLAKNVADAKVTTMGPLGKLEATTGTASQINIDAALANMDQTPAQMQAQIATMDPNDLVTTQMDQLLAGLDNGNIPNWAKPAVAAAEAMLAKRGMGNSTVARDALYNAIIQSALPLAQSNAAALQQRANINLQNRQQAAAVNAEFEQRTGESLNANVAAWLSQNATLQQNMKLANMSAVNTMKMTNLEYEYAVNRDNMSAENVAALENMRKNMNIEITNAQIKQNLGLANLSNEQQTALYNAGANLQMDLTNLSNRQQSAIMNSQLFSSMAELNATNKQKAFLQDIINRVGIDTTNATLATQVSVENARNVLQMDLQNLTNRQRSFELDFQARMDSLLSNQAAQNYALMFNAQSINDIGKFMTNLQASIDMNNAARQDAISTINAQLDTQASMAQGEIDTRVSESQAKLNAAIDQFNETMSFNVDQFNARNALEIEANNVAWRRNVATIDTAAENAANQINAMNAFNLQAQALQNIWTHFANTASWAWQSGENDQDANVRLTTAQLANEAYFAGLNAEQKTEYSKIIGGWLNTMVNYMADE